MVFEICAESLEAVELARKHQVKRVELCAALSLGGLTPSHGLIKQCTLVDGVEVHVMIRHKEGCFVYNSDDLMIMERDILAAARLGACGVVFGCLTNANEVNYKQSLFLYEIAKQNNMEVTFHRAFDFCSDVEESLEQLIDIGFDRVLTSGKEKTAKEGITVINSLVKQSRGRIQIMAGSGVNAVNALQLAQTGVDALHFSVHKRLKDEMGLGMGAITEMDEEKVKSIVKHF